MIGAEVDSTEDDLARVHSHGGEAGRLGGLVSFAAEDLSGREEDNLAFGSPGRGRFCATPSLGLGGACGFGGLGEAHGELAVFREMNDLKVRSLDGLWAPPKGLIR